MLNTPDVGRTPSGHLDIWTDGHPEEHDYVGLAQARPNYFTCLSTQFDAELAVYVVLSYC